MKPRLTDITPPSRPPLRLPEKESSPFPFRKRRRVRTFGFIVLLLLVGMGSIYAIGLYQFKNDSLASRDRITGELANAAHSLTELKPTEAKGSLITIRSELGKLKAKADELGLFKLADAAGAIAGSIKGIPQAFETIMKANGEAITLTGDLEILKQNGFSWFAGGAGDKLIAQLGIVRNDLTTVKDTSTSLEQSNVPILKEKLGGAFLPFNLELQKGERILTSLIDWLSHKDAQHVLVLFQNPSELRPGGGFVGSYGDITLANGSLQNLKVWDIYDPDGQLEETMIPPLPLQSITRTWGARDANWFFDFPTSARKVTEMLERSKIYQEQNVHFTGLLAINMNVVKTILKIVGPIELPEYDTTITDENILPTIQREVEAGKDKAAGEPKRILKVLAPILFEKLGTLSDDGKRELALAMKNHFMKKDIMLNFPDPELQGFAKEMGVAGNIMELPTTFQGSYLGVVHANIASGKSDAVMTEAITMNGTITTDGTLNQDLTVVRHHNGDKETDFWYRSKNKDYLELYIPRDSRLTYLSGNDTKGPSPLSSHATVVDPDLHALEGTRQTLPEFNADEFVGFGKTILGMWVTTARGETKTVEAHYQTPRAVSLGSPTVPFQFIFEKQSGTSPTLDLTLEAPAGYVWENTRASTFTTHVEDLPARLVLDLPLVKLPQ